MKACTHGVTRTWHFVTQSSTGNYMLLSLPSLVVTFVPPTLLSKGAPPAITGLAFGVAPWCVPGACDAVTDAFLQPEHPALSSFDPTLVGLVELLLLSGVIITVLASYATVEFARTIQGKFQDEPIGLPGYAAGSTTADRLVQDVFQERTVPLSKMWLAGAALPTWEELVDGCAFIAESELQNG